MGIERPGFVKHMREMGEVIYDDISPEDWVSFGLYANETHQKYIQKSWGE